MNVIKEYFKQFFYLSLVMLTVLASCKNSADNDQSTGGNYAYKAPVVSPLVFTSSKKIIFNGSPQPFKPVITPFDLDKIPAHSYADSTGFQPFKNPVTTTPFHLDSLATTPVNLDAAIEKHLHVQTQVLFVPKVIETGPPHALTANMFQLSDYQGLNGQIFGCILKDHNGFLWIATDKGIYRYDGNKLVVYLSHLSLFVNKMLEDKQGRIWLMSEDNALAMLDPKAGVVEVVKNNGQDNFHVSDIMFDRQQRLWAVCDGKLNIIDYDKKTVKILGKKCGLPDSCYTLTSDHDNRLWIGTLGHGLYTLDPAQHKLNHITQKQGLISAIGDRVRCDIAGRIWVAGFNSSIIQVFDVKGANIMNINEINDVKFFYELIQNSNGIVSATTIGSGVYNINIGTRQIQHVLFSPNKADQANQVFWSVSNKAGDIWYSTVRGLYLIKRFNNVITHVSTASIASLCEDHTGLVWVAETDGVRIIDRKNRTYKMVTTAEGLNNNSIQTISELQNKIFICSNNGVNIIDLAAKTMESIKNSGFSDYAALIDKDGNWWLGSGNGVDIFNPAKQTMRHLGRKQGLSDTIINDMFKDKDNNIWLGTAVGSIDIVDADMKTIKHLDNEAGLKGTGNKLFMRDTDGSVGIGTPFGLYLVDKKNKTLTFFSAEQGLPDNNVISLINHNGLFYAGTTKGIGVITPPGISAAKKTWTIERFGKNEGVVKAASTFLTDMISRDGSYWWGDNDATELNLSVKGDAPPSIPYISGFKVADKPVYFANLHALKALEKDTLWYSGSVPFVDLKNVPMPGFDLTHNPEGETMGAFSLPANLQLDHDQNYLQFSFTASSSFKVDSTYFRYKLDGANDDWSAMSSEETSRSYFNLKPGNYTFEVESLNDDGIWSQPATFNFAIKKPWWQAWWAYLIYAVLFGGVVWCVVYYRSMQLIKANRILEHKIQVRTEEVLQQKEEIEAQRDHLEAAVKELKLTQTQLIQSEKLASLGELTAGIAHEIQNPLNFINNFSEVNTELIDEMQEEIDKGNLNEVKAIAGHIRENQGKINHHGKRADAIVKGMLQHSRGSGQKELTDINALADEYLRLSYHGLRAKDKSFNSNMQADLDSTLPTINIVPQDMGRVLLNLLNNAFYAVTEKKKTAAKGYDAMVIISTKNLGDKAEITVRDNGDGIPKKVLDKIYQPFFTTKPTGQGTGLGLSMSYDIIKAHGGELKVDTKEGDFTEFKITLPINEV